MSLKMLKSFVNSFNSHSFDEVEEQRKPGLKAKPIYRDELEKKGSKKKAEKNRGRSAAYSKPLLPKEDDGKDFEKKSYGSTTVGKKEVITVKVRMTKQEAARMLSKCKDGGFLDFKDVASVLVHIPPNRLTVVSSKARICPVLESIPEEI